MAKINYVKWNEIKLNHGLNIYCNFKKIICQIYLNICFGN
jgi:hypothetical protein